MSRYGRGGMPTTLYVRNISSRCRYDDLKSFFSHYGKILDITIPLDYYSGMPKGFCFIEFEDPRDAEEAQYRLDRKYFFGREIDVEFARGTRQTASDMRNRDRRWMEERRGGSRDDRRGGYENERYRRTRSRTRSRSREERGGGGGARGEYHSRTNKHSRVERSRSREQRPSYSRSKTRSPSPRNNRSPTERESPIRHQARSLSRESRDRSNSREMA